MSVRSQRNRRRATILGALVGIILIFTFMLSLIAPGLGSSTDDASFPTVTPFGTPAPTLKPTDVVFPTPDPDPSIPAQAAYIHSSGYFQVFHPAGSEWTIREQPAPDVEGIAASEPTYPSVYMQGGPRLVVIHNYIRQGVEYESLESLSENLLTEEYFMGAWIGLTGGGGYESWAETGRTITDDAVITSFELVASGMPYLGRDISRLEGSTLYVTRLVVPDNNPALLDWLTEQVPAQFVGYSSVQTLPREWPIYADQTLGYLLKYPSGLERVAGGEGLPVTFRTADDETPSITIRLDTEADRAVTDPADAEAWLQAIEPSAAISQVTPVSRQFGDGFALTYTFTDVSGDPQSGLAVLLNDTSGDVPQLAIARLEVNTPGLDLDDVESLPETAANARRAVLDGFITLPPSAQIASNGSGAE